MAGWKDFTPEQRDDLLRRKKAGENVAEMAQELGMYPISLARSLQKWEKERLGKHEQAPAQEQIFEDSKDVNHTVLSYSGERILSVEQLLAAAGVDLNEWVVERHQVNKWEGYRRADRKSLRWEDGSIQEGFIEDDGGLHIEPLFQVKVWLVRKRPVAVEPVVRPVNISVNFPDFSPPDGRDTKIVLFIPDVHIGYKRNHRNGKLVPFHDRLALDVVCQIVEQYPFDNIVLLGDFLDMPDWSDKFLRSPDYEQLGQPAIEEAAWWLGRMRGLAPTSPVDYIEGNHEKRLHNWIIKYVPQAYHLKSVHNESVFSAWSIPNLLGLNQLDINWVGDYPNGIVWITDTLAAAHGDTLSADKIVAQSQVNMVFGHIHRFEQSSRTIYRRGEPEVITAMSPGFLGKLDGSVPGAKSRQNWSQGVVMVYYTDDGEVNTFVHVPIKNGRAIVEGQVVVGNDWTEHIAKETGNRWNF